MRTRTFFSSPKYVDGRIGSRTVFKKVLGTAER
jgi:hypothetical protein